MKANIGWSMRSLCCLGFLFMAVATENSSAATFITPGTQAALGGAQSTITSAAFSMPVEAGRSYACSIIGSNPSTQLSLTSPDTAADNWSYCGEVTPKISTGSSDTNHADNRYCLAALTTEIKAIAAKSDVGGGEAARFECLETTLYGGYNTFVNPWNFLELYNTTNTSIRVYITAVNYDGSTVVNNVTYLVPANARQDVDLHTPAGANKYGLVKISHTGPYGAIQGQVSQYRGPVTGMELTASTPVRPRDQNL